MLGCPLGVNWVPVVWVGGCGWQGEQCRGLLQAEASLLHRETLFLGGGSLMFWHLGLLLALWWVLERWGEGGCGGGYVVLLELSLQRGSAPSGGDGSSPACFCFIPSPYFMPAAVPLFLPSTQALIPLGFSP